MTKVNAEELKAITRGLLGDRPGARFYAQADKMLEDRAWSSTSLIKATREIEKIVKLFIGVESAALLGKRYSEYLRSHSFQI